MSPRPTNAAERRTLKLHKRIIDSVESVSPGGRAWTRRLGTPPTWAHGRGEYRAEITERAWGDAPFHGVLFGGGVQISRCWKHSLAEAQEWADEGLSALGA